MKMLFEGSISVKAVMLAEKREVSKIFIDQNKHDKDTDFIIKLARSKAIEIVRSKREEIDKLTEKSSHGGVIAY
ncbi:MAG: RNA methyltransferase substrate-binding domain-containing protein, partial [Erysipelotrichaceae bacterium]|nr:RNA methyltransferase substrate-binding domain-containing protein [Erysipelotrichaceae bacterium]